MTDGRVGRVSDIGQIDDLPSDGAIVDVDGAQGGHAAESLGRIVAVTGDRLVEEDAPDATVFQINRSQMGSGLVADGHVCRLRDAGLVDDGSPDKATGECRSGADHQNNRNNQGFFKYRFHFFPPFSVCFALLRPIRSHCLFCVSGLLHWKIVKIAETWLSYPLSVTLIPFGFAVSTKLVMIHFMEGNQDHPHGDWAHSLGSKVM